MVKSYIIKVWLTFHSFHLNLHKFHFLFSYNILLDDFFGSESFVLHPENELLEMIQILRPLKKEKKANLNMCIIKIA